MDSATLAHGDYRVDLVRGANASTIGDTQTVKVTFRMTVIPTSMCVCGLWEDGKVGQELDPFKVTPPLENDVELVKVNNHHESFRVNI
jgi:hypothetical protein